MPSSKLPFSHQKNIPNNPLWLASVQINVGYHFNDVDRHLLGRDSLGPSQYNPSVNSRTQRYSNPTSEFLEKNKVADSMYPQCLS